MCAIAGAIYMEMTPDTIEKMLQTMQRRGPDGNGVFSSAECTLLHSRLAIIDPDGGKQPMHLSYAKENLTLVYNGELYNTSEIRNELKSIGHHFCSTSDTEVLLHAFAQWGSKCLDRLNGIFAFAIWDNSRKRLFFARDRIGVKPLFFTETKDGILFASEIKTLLCHPDITPELDRDGAMQVLLLGPGRCPGSGVFHRIRELEPGQYGTYENGHLHVSQYWKLTDRIHRDSFDETAEKTRYLVMDAIRRQMVSDVPLGTFLSGGLDSSIITAICAKEMEGKGECLPTFSVDYLNNDRYFTPGKFQPNSDPEYIHAMLDTFHTQHHWSILSPQELIDDLENATIARDLPGMADVDFSLLAFSRQIRSHVKTALSGECADEIFGGYPWYRDPSIRAKAGFPWSQVLDQRIAIVSQAVSTLQQAQGYVMDAYRATCQESDILPENSPIDRRTKEMVNLNFRWFMQTLLDRKDRMSMFCGLEVRVPFCDYRIAEYLYGVPWEMKDYMGTEKGLLRYCMRGLLPEKVLYRKKSPYPKTFDPAYEALISERLWNLFEKGDSPLFYLIDKSALEAFLKQEGEWPWYGQLMRRPQTMAFFLQIDFWLRHYQVQFRF